MTLAALVGEVAHLDEISAVRRRREVDDAARAVHFQIATLRIREDEHRRKP